MSVQSYPPEIQKHFAPSVLVKTQKRLYGPRYFEDDGVKYRIEATVRYDDQCGNGHNSFSITGQTWRKGERGPRREDSGGCLPELIAQHFPELAPYIRWHLCGSDGPMYYLANTLYLAGERDCHGLLKGEFRQHTSRGPNQNGGVPGVPNWVLEFPAGLATDVYSVTKPEPVTVEWRAYGRTGEGKARELASARHSAIWPEATDDELTATGLEARLLARLPALMAAFKHDVEVLGFTY